MSNDKKKVRKRDFHVDTPEQARWQMRFVVNTLLGIPSQQDKLPVYIFLRLEAIKELCDELGWENVLGDLNG